MKWIPIVLFFFPTLVGAQEKETDMTLYDFTVKKIDGTEISMAQYKGKVLLIVNTASKCGFTPQYKGLEKLYQSHKDQGLMILGFPCNQFSNQEPGTDEEISNFCQVNYGVSFPMFSKIDINGENAHPLYKYLKAQAKGLLGSEKIKWNFTKFLVDSNGEVLGRFASTTKPASMVKEIEALLNESD